MGPGAGSRRSRTFLQHASPGCLNGPSACDAGPVGYRCDRPCNLHTPGAFSMRWSMRSAPSTDISESLLSSSRFHTTQSLSHDPSLERSRALPVHSSDGCGRESASPCHGPRSVESGCSSRPTPGAVRIKHCLRRGPSSVDQEEESDHRAFGRKYRLNAAFPYPVRPRTEASG